MAAIALHFMHYNFCRVHKTLRVTPGNGSWLRASCVDGGGAGRAARIDEYRIPVLCGSLWEPFSFEAMKWILCSG